MNYNFKNIFINLFSSNFLLFIVSIAISLVLPLYLTVEDYGYWQVFYLYSGFLGIFMLGLNDGISLNYVGIDYKKIDYELFNYFLKLVIFLSLFFFAIGVLTIKYLAPQDDPNREFIFLAILLNIVFFNVNGFFLHLNQITSRFKLYSICSIMDRILFVILILPFLYSSTFNYSLIILLNLLSRLLLLFFNLYSTREILKFRLLSFKIPRSLLVRVFVSGSKITMAGLLTMLILNFPRLFIERAGNILTFGYYSFANSLISVYIQLMVPISIILFPLLKKLEKKKLPLVKELICNVFLVLNIFFLTSFFIVSYLIENYIKKYNESIFYICILMPLVIYIIKQNYLFLTYYKILRLEKNFLWYNLFGSICIVFYSIIIVFLNIEVSIYLCGYIFLFIIYSYFIEKKLDSLLNLSSRHFLIEIFTLILYYILIFEFGNNFKTMFLFIVISFIIALILHPALIRRTLNIIKEIKKE